MTLSYSIENINYRSGDCKVVIMTHGAEASHIFDIRVINSRAFVSDKINATCVKCLSQAPFRNSISYKERPKEIITQVYESLKTAREKYQRIQANQEKTYG